MRPRLWWVKNQQHGLYCKSVQAENILGAGWLLYSTKQKICAPFQAAIERRLGKKYEVRFQDDLSRRSPRSSCAYQRSPGFPLVRQSIALLLPLKLLVESLAAAETPLMGLVVGLGRVIKATHLFRSRSPLHIILASLMTHIVYIVNTPTISTIKMTIAALDKKPFLLISKQIWPNGQV